ncbi:DUF2079 domain-containing protein [Paractinoplanes atraurantiacus]|uniref:DUF6311 domain-containing protein n=1 Tax=Paractinoplanes atraurantiacus TaxID=1036182 RepID=A0A285HCI8_9ACTN|nr:DUF2079 domain-containing protein [Actinoplanes atraurantiacus]SNY33293.1 hypothetical protein SAMN05421748_104113 [Actinoplanes atraurantiacus]
MSVAAPTTPAAADRPAAPDARAATKRLRAPLLVALAALALALYVTSGLWSNPYRHAVADNVGDQAFFEWVLAYGVHLLQHGGDPFFTDLLNAPDGVNLAANTSITVYAILFAPLTMLAGPQITFVTILTLNLAGSAFAWYLFLCRWVTPNRVAAAVGGLFAGFAPGFISHANGHLNWTSGWIAPLVLWQLLRMRDQRHWIRGGLILGVVLAVSFSIAAEGLFFTALAGGVFVITWALAKPNRAEARKLLPRFLGALGLTAVVAGALLAYPLYMHFAGPQTFKGTGFNQRHYSEDIASFFAFADRSIAAGLGLGSDLAPNPTEETSFFGLPLMVLMIGALVALWRRADEARRATLRALIVVGAVFFVVALGPRLRLLDTELPIPLPYALLQKLPLFDAALPLRFALVLVGVFAVVLALIIDRLYASAHKKALVAALVLALVPIYPLPLLYRERAAEPTFISSGAWKDYTSDGGVISALPFAINVAADGQRWQAYTMARGGGEFRIPDGYFLGPDVQGKEGKGRIGAVPRATDWLFLRAALYGYIADLDNWDRASARADFQRWGITAVYLPDGEITGPEGPLFRQAVETTATDLLGKPEHVDDALVWRIRPGVDPIDR